MNQPKSTQGFSSRIYLIVVALAVWWLLFLTPPTSQPLFTNYSNHATYIIFGALCLPLLVLTWHSKKKWPIFGGLGLWLLAYFFLARLLNRLLGFFPPAPITDKAIIGYAAYHGYPLYFETLCMTVLLFLPLMILIIVRLATRRRSR